MFNSNQQQQHIQQLYQQQQKQSIPQLQTGYPPNPSNYGNPSIQNINNLLQQQLIQNMPALPPNIPNMGMNMNPLALGMGMNGMHFPSNIPPQQIQQLQKVNQSPQPSQQNLINQHPMPSTMPTMSSPPIQNQPSPFNPTTKSSPVMTNANQPMSYSAEKIKQLITTAQSLRAKGETNDPEYIRICQILSRLTKQSQNQQPQSQQPPQQPQPQAHSQSKIQNSNQIQNNSKINNQKPPSNNILPPQQTNVLPPQSNILPPQQNNVLPPQSNILPPKPNPNTLTKSQIKNSLSPQSTQPNLNTLPPNPTSKPIPVEEKDIIKINNNGKPNEPLSSQQIQRVQYQLLAYKLMAKGQPIPDNIKRIIFDENKEDIEKVNKSEKHLNENLVESKIVDSTLEIYKNEEKEKENYQKPGVNIPYTDPYSLINKKITYSDYTEKQHRLLIPSITPTGIDVYSLIQEREKQIKSRIQYRIQELESLPSNISNQTQSLSNPGSTLNNRKLKTIIELKSLKLLEKQKHLRSEMLKGMVKATTLITAVDRASYRRMKKQSLREARITEKLERQQRVDREKRERQNFVDYLNSIVSHGREMRSWHDKQQNKANKLGLGVQRYHKKIENEEVQRLAKLSQERLRALKADDEEAYLKLIDQTKDTRITYLLHQTNEYLENLTKAVVSQQEEIGQDQPNIMADDDFGLEEDDKKADYYGISHRVKEIITEQPSILTGGTLKEYQLKGLQWMVSLYNNRLNGILADEMGLGKTIQTISLICHLIERKHQNGPFLIIVPLSTLTNWSLEFDKWAPSIIKVVYKGAPSVRKAIQFSEIKHGNFNVVLTTYEYVIKDRPVLSKIKWIHIIIDEGHRLKNANSKLTNVLTTHYSCRYRLILTGTPLQNNLPELWALLNFLLPKIFNSVESFDEWFNSPFATQVGEEKIQLNEEEQLLIIRRLHKVLRPFLLRRLKKDVEHELPDKVERVVKCRMSALQRRLYEKMRQKGILFTNDGKHGVKGLNNTVMQLRKIVNHPFVFEEVENTINPSGLTNDLIYRTSGKFELLDRILPKFFKTKHRVLMFFQMTAIMNIMEDFLIYRGYRHLRLDGSTKSEERSDLLKKFNAENSPYMIFLLSTRAGGLGLNLQTADTVIIFDSDWNPHQDLQAQDRAHRIGQTKEVRILRLITADSIEEKILARAQYKLDIDGKVIQAGKFDNKSTAQEREALLRQLIESSSGEANDVQNEENMTDDDLNELIHRNDEEMAIFKQMDQERVQHETEIWKSYGNKGPLPDRLIQEWELPKIYFMNEEDLQRKEDKVDYGRGQRVRKEVHYDDGLNEEQWLQAVENEDLEEVIEKKRLQRQKRAERKARKLNHLNAHDSDATTNDGEGSEIDTVGSDNQSINTQNAGSNEELAHSTTNQDVKSGRKRGRSGRSRGRRSSSLSNGIKTGSGYKESSNLSTVSTSLNSGENEKIKLIEDASSGLVATPTSATSSTSLMTPQGSSVPGSTSLPIMMEKSNSVRLGSERSGRRSRGGRRKMNSNDDRLKRRSRADVNANVDRSKPDQVSIEERERMTELFERCFKAVEKCQAEDGHRRCELFLEIPSKKLYPDYYIIIKQPIALDIINTRIHSTYYDTVEQGIDDFRLMFSNARIYNQEGSWVFIDAVEMEKTMDDALKDYYEEKKSQIPSTGETEDQLMNSLKKIIFSNEIPLKRPAPSDEENGNTALSIDKINNVLPTTEDKGIKEVVNNDEIDSLPGQPNRKKIKVSNEDEENQKIPTEDNNNNNNEENKNKDSVTEGDVHNPKISTDKPIKNEPKDINVNGDTNVKINN